MPVHRVQGNLLEQRVDAIVNAWNRNFIPWWLLLPQGVSKAIKRGAGYAPFRELARHGTMRAGDAVVTSAGRLPFRAIIHVAALEWYWRATAHAVTQGVKNAIDLARRHAFASLAFPALGAGTGGMPVAQSLSLMEAAIAEADAGTLNVVLVEYRRP